jgi:folate-dependent phosphoribosylglycinamide formyltransferase PurN
MANRVAPAAPIGPAQLDVVVLTSRIWGVDVAAELRHLPQVRSLTIVSTQLAPGRPLLQKLRTIHRYHGRAAVWEAVKNRLRRPSGPSYTDDFAIRIAERCPGIKYIHCDDLHSPASLQRLNDLAPDLGVVFATYWLRPEVFNIPRLGCLNLHLGRAPEFRGSSPGFYEMFEGVPEVGVTVHRVSEGLDAGPILLQETFPLDLAPAGDPVAYLQRYQLEVLIPNGVRLMAQAVRDIAGGTVIETPQSTGRRPRRRATFRQQQELRQRVAARRRAAASQGSSSPRTIDIPTS